MISQRTRVLLFLLCGTGFSPVGAQVAVFDAPNQAHFIATVEALKAQLEQIRELSAGVRGVRAIFGPQHGVLEQNNLLPTDLNVLYRALATGSSNAINSSPCIARDQASLATCRIDAQKTALDQQLAAAMYAAEPTRRTELDRIQGALIGSSDLKASADLSALTGIDTASIQSERLQVELFALQSSLQDQAIAKARRSDQLSRVLAPSRAIDSLAAPTL